MQWSDYVEEVRNCAQDFIDEEYRGDDVHISFQDLFDIMMNEDSVTGNGSGSFTMDRATAEENVDGILWDGGMESKFRALGYDGFPTSAGPEAVDVIARCIALDELYRELEEYFLYN